MTPVVSSLTNLQELLLDNNRLTKAPELTTLIILRLLGLSNNLLTETPVVSSLTNLQQLWLSNNKLTVAPVVSSLTNLQQLWLGNNKLTVAPVVSSLTNLEMLGLSNNKLTKISLGLCMLPQVKIGLLQNPFGRTSVNNNTCPASLPKIVYNLASKECISAAFTLAKKKVFSFSKNAREVTHKELMILEGDTGLNEHGISKMLAKMQTILKMLMENMKRIQSRIAALKHPQKHAQASPDELELLLKLEEHLKLYDKLEKLILENRIYLGNPLDSYPLHKDIKTLIIKLVVY
jgi:hypothetical protein